MENTIENLGTLANILNEDVNNCHMNLQTEDSQFWRRVYIRTCFSGIEAEIYAFKQIALEQHEKQGGLFNEGELALLNEHSYDVSDKGEAHTQQKFIQLTKNIKFAFKAFARSWSITYEFPADQGWTSFVAAVKIRNRLTHPKNHDDLTVSSEDLREVITANIWFVENTLFLMKAMLPYLKDSTDQTDSGSTESL